VVARRNFKPLKCSAVGDVDDKVRSRRNWSRG
jgi:hypothetical protein